MLALALGLLAAQCSKPTAPTPPVDQSPDGPTITCPAAPPPVVSPNSLAVPVQYGSAVSSGGAPAVSVACAPPSGATFAVGSTTVTCTAVDARQRSSSCTFVVQVQAPPKISVTRFVAFGDSITWGEDGRDTSLSPEGFGVLLPKARFPTSQTYPGALQIALQTRYASQTIQVGNAGQSGEKAGTSETITRFSGATRIVDVVLLMEGTNDLGDRDSRDIPPAIASLRAMIQDARSRGLRVFLATVPPMVPGGPRALAWSLVPTLNDSIRSLAASEGVALVDVHAALAANTAQYIGFDGLHPSADGYAKIADTFFASIKAALEVPVANATSYASVPLPLRRRR